ncbi:rRNA methyltransferase 3, mitochondrial [Coccinella septempunctata]|uniref:rRNA methyltransferase 3, mitochondrial n=1 Tax=Coccinella septempunctata TaxID=41139 RepID=UPI001D094BCD|nr:rRNA methyltransferase 3, mitochondrial [Coccinella septempunctata]
MFIFKLVVSENVQKLANFQQIRYMPRWSSRTPKRVYYPEEMEKDVEMELIPSKDKKEPPQKSDYPISFSFNSKQMKSEQRMPTLRKMKKQKESTTDMLETIIDGDGNIIFTKMKDNDPRVARVLSNLKSAKSLKKQESFLVEGKRLISEALKSGCKLQYILFSRKDDVDEIKPDLPKLGAQLYKMPYNEMQMWSELTTSPGIMGVFKIPDVGETKYSLPVNIICDNIREPGNLGSILRTCAAVGCKSVILTKGCCDVWNSKVLRGAMGAHFKIKIEKLDWKEIEQNVNTTSWFIADNSLVKTSKNSSMILDTINEIPMEAYDELKYIGTQEMSLIIGGETEGVSQEAYSLVHSKGGLRINIPLGNNVESLNSSTALGVLLFEMRRQIKTS